MASRARTSSARPGPDDLVEGQVWWSSGKPGVVSDKHFFSSIQIHDVLETYVKLSLSVMGDSSGIVAIKKIHALKFRDKLLSIKI